MVVVKYMLDTFNVVVKALIHGNNVFWIMNDVTINKLNNNIVFMGITTKTCFKHKRYRAICPGKQTFFLGKGTDICFYGRYGRINT